MYSIAIPAYKASFLKECIDSILKQTNPDFELIIVNDASPENIDEIVAGYSDKRIRYYKNEKNFGAEHVVDNWNKCLSYAKGDYFVLMGDDDRMEPDFLSEFDLLISKYPALDVYHCRAFIINEKSEKIALSPSWSEFESVYENMWHRINTRRLQFISDFVYKTSTLNANGGFYKLPLAWASDDISSYIAMSQKGIAHTNKPVFCYRRNSQTISSTGSITLKLEAISLEKEWMRNFLAFTPNSLIDNIFHQNLSAGVIKHIQKKRIQTISHSFSKGLIPQFIKWFFKRKSAELRVVELLYSVLEFLKRKKTQQFY